MNLSPRPLIKKFDELSLEQLYRIIHLREKIFVVEQNSPYLDADFLDFGATHFFYQINSEVVACLRVYESELGTCIGRVVVDQQLRRSGIGRRLMLEAMDYIKKENLKTPVYLNAQTRYAKFYASFGFKEEGSEFTMDGIPHIKMLHPG